MSKSENMVVLQELQTPGIFCIFSVFQNVVVKGAQHSNAENIKMRGCLKKNIHFMHWLTEGMIPDVQCQMKWTWRAAIEDGIAIIQGWNSIWFSLILERLRVSFPLPNSQRLRHRVLQENLHINDTEFQVVDYADLDNLVYT